MGVTPLVKQQREDQVMAHTIEVFSAGCVACRDMVEMIERIAGPSDTVSDLDMHQADVAARAKQICITRIPSLIDGKPADCFTNSGA